MKKILLLILLTSSLSNAQFRINKTDSFNVSVVIDPHASLNSHGLHIGGEVEYVGSVYTRFSISNFTALNEGYTDILGSVGASFTSGWFENTRYYTGIRLGVIYRNTTYPTIGGECGVDFMLNNSTFIGLRSTYDYRSDFEFYGTPNEWRYSGFIRVGTKF